jgi:glycosyltransferase involved in cell wall biosynthesis
MSHLIFLSSTPSNIAAGSGTWVGISVLRKAIVALGHRVTLIAPPKQSGPNTTLYRVLFNLRARSLLGDSKADALIGFDLDGVFVRRRELFRVAAIKGVLADEARFEEGTRRIALAVQARLESAHVSQADRVITTSMYSSERIATSYRVSREKIAVVSEMIDLDAWRRSFPDSRPRGIRPRVLCVAHLYRRKRIDTLLRAFARIRRGAVLRIVGHGPERARLEQLARELAIAERVDFLGFLPLHALTAEYRSATIFALPTAQEGFGIVFLEAMASSLPVIAGRAGAVPEVVVEGETALLVDPEDDAKLAQLLETLLDDPRRRLAMGAAGHEHVRRYDAPIVAGQFLAAIGIETGDK